MTTPNTVNDGGEAFPWYLGEYAGAGRGMSLRAYFAGQAMQGILTAVTNAHLHYKGSTPSDQIVAQWAVEAADALIAELNKTQQ
jgi:hypothetical protein